MQDRKAASISIRSASGAWSVTKYHRNRVAWSLTKLLDCMESALLFSTLGLKH